VTYEEFREIVLQTLERILRSRLEKRLKFAAPDEVYRLCMGQLAFADLSQPILEELLAEMPNDPPARKTWCISHTTRVAEETVTAKYVEDAEQAAEYLANETTEARQKEIRDHYMVEYAAGEDSFLVFTLRAMLLDRFPDHEVDTLLPSPQEQVEEKIFALGLFGKTMLDYCPSKKGSFRCFFQQRIVWRCIDVVRQLENAPHVAGDPYADHPQPYGDTSDLAESKRKWKSIGDWMDRLQRADRANVPEWGAKARAVFDLRHKAYINPRNFGKGTKRKIETLHGSKKLDALAQEYHECCKHLKDLQEKLAESDYDIRRTCATIYALRRHLESLGQTASYITQLEVQAKTKTIDELDEESRKTPNNSRERDEIRFMIAFRRMNAEEIRRSKQLESQASWTDCEGEWVRKYEEIGVVLGIDPQRTAKRRLTEAKEFLEKCLKK